MTDRYLSWVHSPMGKRISKAIGLPRPAILARRDTDALDSMQLLLGQTEKTALSEALAQQLNGIGYSVTTEEVPTTATADNPRSNDKGALDGLILDASALQSSDDLSALYSFVGGNMRRLGKCARVLVIGRPPEACADAGHRMAQRALEGFVRSVAKELRHGGTAQTIYVHEGAEVQLESTLRFFCSGKSAYVNGQVVRLRPAPEATVSDWALPLKGKKALVTGAARGIGEAIARTLAADGAEVIGLDVPNASDALDAVMQDIGGHSLPLDIIGADTAEKLCSYFKETHGGVDIVVHNAGVTRDRMLANMDLARWQLAMDINLEAPLKINQALLDNGALNNNASIIGVSSISGISGNPGQSNYSTSKAGVIGMVDAFASVPNDQGITINAVAPGFIETEMTAKVPFVIRQAGRRMNSMKQGGLPVDVAETISWMASPASAAVTGNTVRVCGQSLIGA